MIQLLPLTAARFPYTARRQPGPPVDGGKESKGMIYVYDYCDMLACMRFVCSCSNATVALSFQDSKLGRLGRTLVAVTFLACGGKKQLFWLKLPTTFSRGSQLLTSP